MFEVDGSLFSKGEKVVSDSVLSLKGLSDETVFTAPYEYANEANAILEDISLVEEDIKKLIKKIESARNSLIFTNNDFRNDYLKESNHNFLDFFRPDFFSDSDENNIDDKKTKKDFPFFNFPFNTNSVNDSEKSKILKTILEELGEWYISNIPTYWGNRANNPSSPRKYYETPYGRAYADDCSDFAIAYMSMVSGHTISTAGTTMMVDPNGEWAKKVEKYGWKCYTADEIGTDLRPGDVLISSTSGYVTEEGVVKSSKGDHAEIYIDENHTFGWGEVQDEFPSDREVEVNIDNSVSYEDKNHEYIIVYRYEGDLDDEK